MKKDFGVLNYYCLKIDDSVSQLIEALRIINGFDNIKFENLFERDMENQQIK